MLDEDEWQLIEPLLSLHVHSIKEIRQQHHCDLKTARQMAGQPACDLYFEMTGFRETNIEAIWHHRLSLYGPECPRCGQLLRTSKAKMCAHCGLREANCENWPNVDPND